MLTTRRNALLRPARVGIVEAATIANSFQPRKLHMPLLSLLRQGSPLAEGAQQVALLERTERIPPFHETLAQHRLGRLTATGISVLQVNVGRLCNQTCRH